MRNTELSKLFWECPGNCKSLLWRPRLRINQDSEGRSEKTKLVHIKNDSKAVWQLCWCSVSVTHIQLSLNHHSHHSLVLDGFPFSSYMPMSLISYIKFLLNILQNPSTQSLHSSGGHSTWPPRLKGGKWKSFRGQVGNEYERDRQVLAVNSFNLSMEDTRESTNRLCRTCSNDADTIQLKFPYTRIQCSLFSERQAIQNFWWNLPPYCQMLKMLANVKFRSDHSKLLSVPSMGG